MVPSSVRTGLATRLATITGLHVYELIPEVISSPCAIVDQLDLNFDTSMHGGSQATVDVLLVVQRTSERAGQLALDGYLATTGTGSVKAAIEGDTTLGGAVQTLRVLSATPGQYESQGVMFLAYRYRIQIYA